MSSVQQSDCAMAMLAIESKTAATLNFTNLFFITMFL